MPIPDQISHVEVQNVPVDDKHSLKASVYAGIILAVLLGVIGAGISTRDIARDNSQEILRIIDRGKQLQSQLEKVERDLEKHEKAAAHREAELRLQALEFHVGSSSSHTASPVHGPPMPER